MIDTSGIDILAVIDQMACLAWRKPVRSRGEVVYKGGPCPFCGLGTDRFAVFPTGEKPHFYCGIHGTGCGTHGDVIAFVQRLRGYNTVNEAIHELGAMGFEVGDKSAGHAQVLRPERGKPCKAWQDMGNALVHAAQKYLWSSVGSSTREYLYKRGFNKETILHFRLGYWPEWTSCSLSSWGLANDTPHPSASQLWIRPGIIIPWYEGSTLWKINQRVTEYTAKEREQMVQGKRLPRYKQIKGSSNGLFNVDALREGEPVVMTEGELCAMTLAQETKHAAVATGSTKGAQLSRWVATLSLASHVLVAFDNDQGKGENAATYWLDVFEDKASLWLPWAKDINEMKQMGMDIAAWVALGRQLASHARVEENGDDHSEERVIPTQLAIKTDGSLCFACLNEDRETPAHFVGPDDLMYCKSHYDDLPSELRKADMEVLVQRYRQALPGWEVSVEARWTHETPLPQ
jgi:hypothetical protein